MYTFKGLYIEVIIFIMLFILPVCASLLPTKGLSRRSLRSDQRPRTPPPQPQPPPLPRLMPSRSTITTHSRCTSHLTLSKQSRATRPTSAPAAYTLPLGNIGESRTSLCTTVCWVTDSQRISERKCRWPDGLYVLATAFPQMHSQLRWGSCLSSFHCAERANSNVVQNVKSYHYNTHINNAMILLIANNADAL